MSQAQAYRSTPTANRFGWVFEWLALSTAILIVFHGALGYFFSQDDFGWIARARGLLPASAGPWRVISLRLYFEAMGPVAGLNAGAYHAVSLAVHIVSSVLVWALLRRHLAMPAAWIGAVFFAVHPAHFTAVYWISALGDTLALAFAVGAVLLGVRRGRERWLALPCFALSLLSKESTVLLPLWFATYRALAPEELSERAIAGEAESLPPWHRDPLVWSMGVVTLAYVASFVAMNVSGIRQPSAENAAYSLSGGAAVPRNLLTYLGWSVNVLYPTVRAFADAIEPRVFPAGIAAGLLWLLGLAWPALRARGWLAAGLWFAALILPVLFLGNHTYHYYLCASLVGTAWCGAAVVDVLVRERLGSWIALWLVALLLTINSALLVHKIEVYPFILPELRADPVIDRARIAANVRDDLAAAMLPDGARLRFWSPAAIALDRQRGNDVTRESYWERNVRSALYDGWAVRLLFPRVGDISFVREAAPAEEGTRYAIYTPDGHLSVITPATLDSLMTRYGGTP